MFREPVAQEFKCVLWCVGELEQFRILRSHSPSVDERLEVDYPVPVFAPVYHDQNFLRQLVGLRQRQDLEKLIHGAEAAREDHESLRKIGEPELAHEEVVKLKVQRRSDVLVRILLERKLNIQSDRLSSGFMRAEIGRLHDPGASARSDDEPVAAGGNLDRPLG